MRQFEPVFIDTGAWIALALTRDPYHSRARELWRSLLQNAAPLFTSIPVVLETFTFLARNAPLDVALSWKDSLLELESLTILECAIQDLNDSWKYFERRDLHKLSAVDATNFSLMKRESIGLALSFDYHFVTAGFRLVG